MNAGARRRVLTGLSLGALTAACWPQDESPALLTIEPVVGRLAATLKPGASPRPLRRLEYEMTMSPSGAATSASATYDVVSPNLWAVTTVQKIKAGYIQSRSVSLCGLVDLISASTSALQLQNTVPVPVGPLIISMGIPVSKTLYSKSRTVTLTIPDDSVALCVPQPGAVFSYVVQMETELPKPPIGAAKVLTNSFDWRCVAADAIKAGQIGTAAASQNYIPVTCTSASTASRNAITSEYAYLVEAGVYLKLQTTTDTLQARTNYSGIEFAP